MYVPLFTFAENQAGKLYFHFDIPPEAPTVRGFASVLHDGVNGSTPEDVPLIPDQFYLRMGLHTVITGQRLNGIGAMLLHMKRLAEAQMGASGYFSISALQHFSRWLLAASRWLLADSLTSYSLGAKR